jgi:hypothetical protein
MPSAAEEDAILRQSRELLAGDRLGALSGSAARSRPTMRDREQAAERVKFSSPEDLAQRADMLSEQARRRGFDPLFAAAGEGDEHDRLSVKSEESETGSQMGLPGRHASDAVHDFVDVTKLSAASRRSAAPHIYNIFEQIFIDTDAPHQRPAIPELPEAVRASMRASGVHLEEELGLTGTRAEVVMTLDESWQNLTGGTGSANRLAKQLVADLAIALRIDKARIHVTNVRQDGAGVRAELLLMPGGDHEPSAVEAAEALSLQAGSPKSMLHAMNSTRRATDVRFREVQPAVLKGMHKGQSGPYEALLRGGVVVDDRGVRPMLSAVHGMAPTDVKRDSLKRQSALPLHSGEDLRTHQRDLDAMHKVDAARRQQEGFWVDVDRGVYLPVQTNAAPAYGTFYTPRQKKVCGKALLWSHTDTHMQTHTLDGGARWCCVVKMRLGGAALAATMAV